MWYRCRLKGQGIDFFLYIFSLVLVWKGKIKRKKSLDRRGIEFGIPNNKGGLLNRSEEKHAYVGRRNVFTLIHHSIPDQWRCGECLPLARSDWNIRRSSLLRPAVTSQLPYKHDQTPSALSGRSPRYQHHSKFQLVSGSP